MQSRRRLQGFPADGLTFPSQRGGGATRGKDLLCVLPVCCGAEREAGSTLPHFYLLLRSRVRCCAVTPLQPPPFRFVSFLAHWRGGRWRSPPPGEFPGLRPNISHHLSPPRTGIPQGGEGQGKDPGYCLNPCLLSRSPASLQTCFLLHSRYFREAPRRQARTRSAVALGTPVPIALPAVPPQSEPRPPAQRSLFPAGELSA